MSVDNKKIKLNYTIINTQNDFLQEVLQESQNDYNEVNSHGETLLIGLKNKCSDESISTLLNRCCNINIANEAGETALHFAVQRDTINVAYILIKMGADVNLKNKNGYTPLHIAAKYGGITILQEILRFQHLKKDERNHLGETALYLSLSVNRPDDIVSALIDAGCNVNFPDYRKKQTPLHLAVLRQFPSIAYKLIENGSDMNAQDYRDGMTPLHVAIRKCSDEELILTLIDLACDINTMDNLNNTPLHYAAYRKPISLAKKLLQKGANLDFVNLEGDTLLHHAVNVGNLEFLCMLLYYNLSANELNGDRRTPFFESVCSYGFDGNTHGKDIVQCLINYVTDINQMDADRISVLHIALMNDYDIALDILNRGAQVNKCFKQMHCLYFAWTDHTSYEVLKIVWQKTNFKKFKKSKVRRRDYGKSFLKMYCEHCRLPNEQFLKYLFMMFDSPYIEDLLQPKWPDSEEPFINIIVASRDLILDQRLDMISVFLSYGVNIYFKDICALYERYGFDESLEALLTNGCYIYPSPINICHTNLLIYRICYDTELKWNDYQLIGEYFDDSPCFMEKGNFIVGNEIVVSENRYYEYYRATIRRKYDEVLYLDGISSSGELRSLLEISRDAVRKEIFKKWSTFYSFNVYPAISKLPVPLKIRDILYLKRPIYTNV